MAKLLTTLSILLIATATYTFKNYVISLLKRRDLI